MRRTLHDLGPAYHWTQLRGSESMIAGAGAGLVSSVLTCPLDVVKTKLQAQGARLEGATVYRGLVGTVRTILQQEGIRGLYRGLGPTIWGYLPTWGIYFTVYDYAKAELARRSHPNMHVLPDALKQTKTTYPHLHRDDEGVGAHMAAAMAAGATSTFMTNPIWVVKTRFMTQAANVPPEERYRHTFDCLRRIYRDDGFRGFYRGLAPSLLGVGHVAIQFPLYERFKKAFRTRQTGLGDSGDLRPAAILACSSSSKMIASVITYPHEVIRTRLQLVSDPAAEHPARKRRRGLVRTAKRIWRDDGFLGFYRGVGVNLLRTVPASAMTILTYEVIMRNLTTLTRPEEHQA